MKKIKLLSMLFIFCLALGSIPLAFTNNVYAQTKNEVTLNFDGGIIHDDYVEYSKVGKLQLFKGDELIVNISNNMTIDLNEADYKFLVQEIADEDTGSIAGRLSVKLNINNWYYPMTKIIGDTKYTFKLESSKFNGILNINLSRKGAVVNTKVENIYTNTSSTGTIDLTNGKEYIIDFSKDDELTEGLKSFADLDKTLYYQKFNESLLVTNNESVAVIKIVGNRSENKAILTAVNVGTKKEENVKGLHTKYTGSKLQFDGSDDDIINETRTDYYTKCTYNFTFKYLNDEVEKKEYKFIEGADQKYIKGESNSAKFRIDADYGLFDNKVYIEGTLVYGDNYTSESGSTIITFKKEYMDELPVGEHTLKVVFSDGGEAITKFEIKEKQQDTNLEDDKGEGNVNQNQNINNEKNPQTGDSTIIYIVMLIVSISGIITTLVINRKKHINMRKD